MTTIQPPDQSPRREPDSYPPPWLNLDAIITHEMRDNIPGIVTGTRAMLAAVENFIRDTLPAWKAIERQIWDATATGMVDHLPGYIEKLTGLDEVGDLVSLAEWALTTVEGVAQDELAEQVIVKRLTGEAAETFSSLLPPAREPATGF